MFFFENPFAPLVRQRVVERLRVFFQEVDLRLKDVLPGFVNHEFLLGQISIFRRSVELAQGCS